MSLPLIEPKRSRMEAWLPVAVSFFMGLPLLLVHFPPGADAANHFVTVGIWRYPERYPEGMHFLNLGHSNVLFHAIAVAMAYVLPIREAYCFAAFVAVMSVGWGGSRLAAYLGSPAWTSLLVAPLASSWLVMYGLYPAMMGTALFLGLLPTMDRLSQEPTPARAGWAAGAMVLAYLGHEQAVFMLAGALGLFALLRTLERRDGWRALVLRFFPIVVAAGLFLLNRTNSQMVNARKAGTIKFDPFLPKLVTLPMGIFGGEEPGSSLGQGAWFLLILLGLYIYKRRVLPRTESRQGWANLQERRFALLAASLLALYLFFPETMNGASMLYPRFLAPCLAVTVLVVGQGLRLPRLGGVFVGSVPVAVNLCLFPVYLATDTPYRQMDALLPYIEPGSAVALVDLDNIEKDPYFVFAGYDAYAVVFRGGRSLNNFLESPASPINMRSQYFWTQSEVRMRAKGTALHPSWDLRHYRYLLLDTQTLHKAQVVTKLLEPEVQFVASVGPFTLLRSTLDVVPINSPMEPPPAVIPESLWERYVCAGYLVNDPAWLRSDSNWGDLDHCNPPAPEGRPSRPEQARRGPGELP